MYERVGEQLRYSRSRLGFPSCSWLHTAKELRPWLRQWRWAWVTGGSSSEHERRRMEPGSAGSWGEDRASTAMAELGGGLSASVAAFSSIPLVSLSTQQQQPNDNEDSGSRRRSNEPEKMEH
nr:hypothetical protein Iba_scaffold9932CG0020 [Ipomoea batatas]